MRLLIATFLSFMSVVFAPICSARDNDSSYIHLGKAKVAVRVLIVGDEATGSVDSILNSIDIYAATLPIFAKDGYEQRTLMVRDGNVFHAEVPTETLENIGGLRIYKDGHFAGGFSVEMNQSKPAGIALCLSDDGYIQSVACDNYDMQGLISLAVIPQRALDINSYSYVAGAPYGNGWKAVSEYLSTESWPKFLNATMSECPLPESARSWLTNNIKVFFTYQYILNQKKLAHDFGRIDDCQAPMEAYEFLDSIDYRPNILLKYSTMLPLRYLFEFILKDMDGGMEAIGETPVNDWQSMVDKQLTKAMKSRPQFLLDMLAAMSYILQIEDGTALTSVQLDNISKGLPDDIGRIILNRNKRGVAMADNAAKLIDLSAQSFDLQGYIDSEFPGRPVVVDLWNTWCGPCITAIHQCEDILDDYKNSGIAFLYISDESSPESKWRKMAEEIGFNQLRISTTDRDNLLEQYSLTGFPSYIFFDSNHNAVKAYTSFPGERIYRQTLTELQSQANEP